MTYVDANRVLQDALRNLGVLDINCFDYQYDLNTALARGFAKVQRPCVSFILLNNFLLTEACFHVHHLVAVIYFSTIVFVCTSSVVK